jgi:excisionase family DNA binding protein
MQMQTPPITAACGGFAKSAKPAIQPQFATIKTWVSLSGIGRSQTYNLLASGHLRAVKVGARTLIDAQAGLAWIAAQPAADIRVPCRPRAA